MMKEEMSERAAIKSGLKKEKFLHGSFSRQVPSQAAGLCAARGKIEWCFQNRKRSTQFISAPHKNSSFD
jgi:hypothetical protein